MVAQAVAAPVGGLTDLEVRHIRQPCRRQEHVIDNGRWDHLRARSRRCTRQSHLPEQTHLHHVVVAPARPIPDRVAIQSPPTMEGLAVHRHHLWHAYLRTVVTRLVWDTTLACGGADAPSLTSAACAHRRLANTLGRARGRETGWRIGRRGIPVTDASALASSRALGRGQDRPTPLHVIRLGQKPIDRRDPADQVDVSLICTNSLFQNGLDPIREKSSRAQKMRICSKD